MRSFNCGDKTQCIPCLHHNPTPFSQQLSNKPVERRISTTNKYGGSVIYLKYLKPGHATKESSGQASPATTFPLL